MSQRTTKVSRYSYRLRWFDRVGGEDFGSTAEPFRGGPATLQVTVRCKMPSDLLQCLSSSVLGFCRSQTCILRLKNYLLILARAETRW